MEQLFKAIEKRALDFPEKNALISSDGNRQSITTNKELFDNINSTASFFEKEGLNCIGIFMDNCAQWIICDLAAAKLGITLVPIPLFFTRSQIEHLVTSAGVEAIISQPSIFTVLTNNQPLIIEAAETNLPIENTVVLRILTEQVALLSSCIKVTYTSGSTGEPKGVCLSAQNIGAVCKGFDMSMGSMAMTNHLCVLPLATLLENIAGVYVCLLHGGVVITEPLAALGFLSNAEFDINKLLEKIKLHQVESLILLPQMLTLLVHKFNETVSQQCSSLQFIAVGGGKTSKLTLQQANTLGLPVYEGYGLSECGSVVSLNLPYQHKVGSVGKALPHVCIVISEEGEIIVEGQMMLGYLDELAQPLTRIYTGDLGYIDEEGYIFVSGRKTTKIVSSFGRNISPEWVEASLSSSSVISQVAIFGEAKPSLSAVVYSSDNEMDAISNAIEECNKNLPDYAQVRHWIKAESPFTPTNNLLTNNGRLKRANIATHYQEKLEALYL